MSLDLVLPEKEKRLHKDYFGCYNFKTNSLCSEKTVIQMNSKCTILAWNHNPDIYISKAESRFKQGIRLIKNANPAQIN